MAEIKVEKLSEAELQRMGVRSWPIWTKEVSKFDWSYDSVEQAGDAGLFMTRDEIQAKFRRARPALERFKLAASPIYLDFLCGKRSLPCAAWANPTRNVRGWKGPCYLMTDRHYATYQELLDATEDLATTLRELGEQGLPVIGVETGCALGLAGAEVELDQHPVHAAPFGLRRDIAHAANTAGRQYKQRSQARSGPHTQLDPVSAG